MDSATGAQLGTGDGELEVTDLDQDAFTVALGEGAAGGGASGAQLELPLRIRAADDGGALDETLARLLLAHGAPMLRARLARFCAELKAQEVDGLRV